MSPHSPSSERAVPNDKQVHRSLSWVYPVKIMFLNVVSLGRFVGDPSAQKVSTDRRYTTGRNRSSSHPSSVSGLKLRERNTRPQHRPRVDVSEGLRGTRVLIQYLLFGRHRNVTTISYFALAPIGRCLLMDTVQDR